MGKAHGFGHAAGIVDILPRTASALLGQRRPVIVKLQRHADHVIALFRQLRGHNRAIHAARHGNDDARLAGRLGKAKRIDRVRGGHGFPAGY